MNTKKTTHRKVFLHLCENLDHKLNSPKCRKIKKLLDNCPECFAYLKSLKTTVDLYRLYPIHRPSSAAKKKLRSIIKQQSSIRMN